MSPIDVSAVRPSDFASAPDVRGLVSVVISEVARALGENSWTDAESAVVALLDEVRRRAGERSSGGDAA